MRVMMTKMKMGGVALPSKISGDRAPPRYGQLRILDADDPLLHRPVKRALLLEHETQAIRDTLYDPKMEWCEKGRFMLSGFERVCRRDGDQVDYAQAWLCELETDAPVRRR